MRGCKDEKIWRWEDVNMWCEDEMWRGDVKMRCEDEKIFYRPPQYWKNTALRCSREERLDDGWPESVEQQGLLLLVWRRNFRNDVWKMCYRQSRREVSRPNSEKLLHTVAFTQTLLHRKLLPTEAFTYRSFYTDTFTHRYVYTQTLLHTDPFTHRSCFYTQMLVHTEAFTHRRFYTQALLHTNTFTQKLFCTQALLHTDAFTRALYT